MNVDFELILESHQSKEEIYELQEWIEELHLKGLTVNVKEAEADGETSQMGFETLAILQLVAALAGSAGVVAFVNGIFGCIKSYILAKSDEKQVVLKKGDAEIVFNGESVKDLQALIDKSIEMLSDSASSKALENKSVAPKILGSSDSE